MQEINSEPHPANCPCDQCMDNDCARIIEAYPASTWTRSRLEWIRGLRKRPLNWNLEPGHCALCGGTSLQAYTTGEHWWITGYNPQTVNGVTYLSILFPDDSATHATYSYIIRDKLRQTWIKEGKPVAGIPEPKVQLRDWASAVLGIDRTFARAVAVRAVDVGDQVPWTEVRVGFQYA